MGYPRPLKRERAHCFYAVRGTALRRLGCSAPHPLTGILSASAPAAGAGSVTAASQPQRRKHGVTPLPPPPLSASGPEHPRAGSSTLRGRQTEVVFPDPAFSNI